MNDLAFVFLIAAVVGLWVFMTIRSIARSKVRELEIRERIAMIERGHVPAPEVDPRGFERAMRRDGVRYSGGYRHRRAGTTLIGVGLGLTIMIAMVGDPRTGIGVGGFLVMIGLAFLANGLLDQRQMPDYLSRAENRSTPAIDPPKLD